MLDSSFVIGFMHSGPCPSVDSLSFMMLLSSPNPRKSYSCRRRTRTVSTMRGPRSGWESFRLPPPPDPLSARSPHSSVLHSYRSPRAGKQPHLCKLGINKDYLCGRRITDGSWQAFFSGILMNGGLVGGGGCFQQGQQC